MSLKRLPSATYRVQLNQDFRFADALKILDYLHELGISDRYLSPVLASRKGSGHGYDVTDPTRINPELGTEEEFAALQTELQNRGMGLLLDTVPNHMAASAENPWWMDVLENGTQSAFAAFFDIEWHPHSRSLDGKILLPVLGRPFGEALDSGEITLTFQDGRFFFQYFDSLFPLTPRSYHAILDYRSDRLKEMLGEEAPAYHEYSGILSSVRELSAGDRRSAETPSERRLRFESARDRLKSLVASSREVATFVEENVREINGKQGDPGSFRFLQRLLAEQNYKLAFWQNLNESINYRRFFTIADLVGVRVEDPIVFEATHGLILRLVSKNPFAGLRVDHIDGLRDPIAYLNKLQERLSSDEARKETAAYLLVEKILARHENLPDDWPVSGTTGYDYLNEANGLFVELEGARRIDEIYSTFIGHKQNFADVVYQKKKLVMNTLLGVEMRTLGRHLAELAAQDRYARELNREQLIDALIEVTACLSIYRTYIRNMEVPAHATKYIEAAVTCARERAPQVSGACFDFVREVLLLLNLPHVLVDQRESRLAFVMRWQQFTGPIVAKGLEDTALYVYYPLLSLNEVGGNPEPSKIPPEEDFVEFVRERQRRWPDSLNATSTHDTKLSEGVRARLNVLSEIPDTWAKEVTEWSKENESHKQSIDGRKVPDPNEEYLIYQALVGVWPAERSELTSISERLRDYAIKAIREAMVHTRWTEPNRAHELAVSNFIHGILSPHDSSPFLCGVERLLRKVDHAGMINGLSQALLKIACPGVPDFYQGSELWNRHLVDPDNRRPVDFQSRSDALQALVDGAHFETAGIAGDLLGQWPDGRVKLFVIWKALGCRREHPALFREGEFIPLKAVGERSLHVVSFLRRRGEEQVVIVLPRWVANIPYSADTTLAGEFWQGTHLQLPPETPNSWRNVFTAKTTESRPGGGNPFLTVRDLFADFPVALLVPNETSTASA